MILVLTKMVLDASKTKLIDQCEKRHSLSRLQKWFWMSPTPILDKFI